MEREKPAIAGQELATPPEPDTDVERALESFLAGTDADDLERLMTELRAPPAPTPAPRSPAPPRPAPADAWRPDFRAPEKREMAPPVPDPRRLPTSERTLTREPEIGALGSLADRPEPRPTIHNSPAVDLPTASLFAVQPPDPTFEAEVERLKALVEAEENLELDEDLLDLELYDVPASEPEIHAAARDLLSAIEITQELPAAFYMGTPPPEVKPWAPPKPPPTADLGDEPEPEPLHRSLEGVSPETHFETLTLSGPTPAPAPAMVAAPLPEARPEPEPATPRTPLSILLAEARQSADAGLPYPEGWDLRGRLATFVRLAEAVAAAHAEGRIHGDLRPANVRVGSHHQVRVVGWNRDPGPVDVVQMGSLEASFFYIGEDAGRIRVRQGTDEVIASPRYSAPELWQGGRASVATDVWGLGLLLQEIATLTAPFAEGNLGEVVDAIKASRRAPLAGPEPLPPRILGAINRATAPDPVDRFESVDALLAATGLLEGARMPRPARRREAALAGVTLGAALVLGIGQWGAPEAAVMPNAAAAEAQMAQARASVEARAGRIDTRLLGLEGVVGDIAAQAEAALAGQPDPGPLYRLLEFRTPGKAPPGLVDVASYGGPISLDWPLFKLNPGGAPLPTLNTLARKLHGLRPKLAPSLAGTSLTPEAPPPLIDALPQGRLVGHRVVVSLASGLDLMYPGQGELPDAYDGRQRPYYALGQAGGVRWGAPYPEVHGTGLVMPVAQAVGGAEPGVAALELSVERLGGELLATTGLAGAREAWIVDADGAPLLSRGLGEVRSRPGDLDVPTGTERVPYGPFAEGAPLPGAGAVVVDAGGPALLAWAPLRVPGWRYVVLMDAPTEAGALAQHTR